MDFPESGGSKFLNSAVVGDETINLAFDIGGLGVDAGGDPLLPEFDKFLDGSLVTLDPLILIFRKSAVAPIACSGIPEMVCDREAVPPEFPHDFDEGLKAATFSEVEGEVGVRVLMVIDDVPDGEKIPAGGDVNLAGGVVGRDPFSDFQGAVLSPAFVEGNPLHDGRMIVEGVDHEPEFGHPLVVGFVRPDRFGWIWGEAGPLGADGLECVPTGAGGDLILPDEHPHAVAMGVVAAGLDLDVLADGVEASLFEKLDVGDHRGLGRRGEETIRPPALVEGAEVKEGFSIEGETEMSVLVPRDRSFSDSKVGCDPIDLIRSLLDDFEVEVVEGWVIGRPEIRVFDLEFDFAACGVGTHLQGFALFFDNGDDGAVT